MLRKEKRGGEGDLPDNFSNLMTSSFATLSPFNDPSAQDLPVFV
jgi:hypothetical protein